MGVNAVDSEIMMNKLNRNKKVIRAVDEVTKCYSKDNTHVYTKSFGS